jgi:hypothetical protein
MRLLKVVRRSFRCCPLRRNRVDRIGLVKQHHLLHLDLRSVHIPNTLAPLGLWPEIYLNLGFLKESIRVKR